MAPRKNNYTKKKDLQAEIMAVVDGSGEQDYIIIEVLKLVISEIKGRKEDEENHPG